VVASIVAAAVNPGGILPQWINQARFQQPLAATMVVGNLSATPPINVGQNPPAAGHNPSDDVPWASSILAFNLTNQSDNALDIVDMRANIVDKRSAMKGYLEIPAQVGGNISTVKASITLGDHGAGDAIRFDRATILSVEPGGAQSRGTTGIRHQRQ